MAIPRNLSDFAPKLTSGGGFGSGSAATPTALGTVYGLTTAASLYTTALGYVAGGSLTGAENVALGAYSQFTSSSGAKNTAVGVSALYSNTASNNSAFGNNTLQANTTGTSNSAFGFNALYSNTTASNNTAVGYQAAYSNTTGVNFVALGYQAGYSCSTANGNTSLGYQANYSATGSGNTSVGSSAGYSLTSGGNNSFCGSGAGYNITTGSKNSILGAYSGNQGGLDIRTASNYIVLSDGDGNPRLCADGNAAWRIPSGRITVNAATFSSGAQGYIEVEGDPSSVRNLFASNNTAAGTSSVGFFAFKRNGTYTGGISQTDSATSFVTSSDYRLKENVSPMTGALAKVSQLKPCTYTWKASGEASQGFIAHELAEVCPEAVFGEKDAVYEDGSIKSQGIDTSFLVATLTAAIQELNAKFEAYKATHP